MASTLCCTAEQGGRADSPELPNARASQAAPANRPLLPKTVLTPQSGFTSARSEDLLELREIFDSAQDPVTENVLLSRMPRPRFSRPSMHSLRSLHKMSSMRSIIRRKFSKDSPGQDSVDPLRRSMAGDNIISEEYNTVIKQPNDGLGAQIQVTKDALRRDLLSDEQPDQGGYDPDAEMLDDIAKNIGRKTPAKRPSLHSIDWTPSTGRYDAL